MKYLGEILNNILILEAFIRNIAERQNGFLKLPFQIDLKYTTLHSLCTSTNKKPGIPAGIALLMIKSNYDPFHILNSLSSPQRGFGN